jgi:c-di-AMP phosphodiesterase-like protein
MDESHRPLTVAMIDSVLNQFAIELKGIIRKYENDKYLLITTKPDMEEVKKGKFEVLEKVREIRREGAAPVTLSIGIGLGRGSVAENMEDARGAVDLALGRGGDQAVIKEGGEFSFFGGAARDFAVNTRTRARLKAFAFTALVRNASNVVVMGHKNMDLDCLGAAVGVYKVVSALDKRCEIVIGEMSRNVQRIHERLLKESSLSGVFVPAQDARKGVGANTLLVVVDTYRPSLVESLETLNAAERQFAKVVVFDHHRMAADFIKQAVMVYHEPFASSACELVTEVMESSRLNVKLKPVEADALLAGITVDTKNFSIKTGARTFEAAAYLRRAGADGVRIKMLFQSDFASFRAKSAAVGSAEVIFENVAVSVSSAHVENPQIVAAQTADELLNIDGIEASFVLCYWDGAIIISARSLGGINVQLIMEKLGGGGHATVAGAQLYEKTYDDLNEAEEQLKNAISEYLRKG